MDNYHNDEQEIRTGLMTQAVFVYPWAIRVWHWVNALAIVVLCVTGYLIGKPLPTQQGEATFLFLMGYIRFIHFAAGYIMAIGFLLRIYMAIVGNHHAREMFTIPFRNRQFWQELVYVMKSYAFMRTLKHRYVGHNPMSRLSMIGFAGLSVFMIMTGFALYGEGTLAGSWANWLFSSWMIPLFGGNSQNLHTLHHLGMWLMIVFVMIHVYAAIREEIVGRQSMVSTMVSGWRFFKD
ncbi:MAG: Ni/Fe-hydrogenase, b-type cytochrome subunit [Moraxella sp.]